jgi:coenzyme F420-reducing hydrogenase delta subunit
MVERAAPRTGLVARVDPALCVSCGICAGSCAPMGVGPPGRTGRDQMADVRQFVSSPERRPGELVVLCCGHGPAALAEQVVKAGGVPYSIDCAGNLHTSVVELLVRGGAGGVLVLSCPPRDCRHREGPKWLVERVFNGREAELQPRVPRARVGLSNVAAGDVVAATRAVHDLAGRIAGLETEVAARFEPTPECDSAPAKGLR